MDDLEFIARVTSQIPDNGRVMVRTCGLTAIILPSGKVPSGGIDANALNKPKKFFGSAGKVLSRLGEVEAMELMIDKLGKTKTNQDFLNAMSKGL